MNKKKKNTSAFLSSVALFLQLVLPLVAAGPREPLTSRDYGLYCGWTEYFVSSNCPFDFFVVQAFVKVDGISWYGTENKERSSWNLWLRRARAQGKRVIADVTPWAVDPVTGKDTGFAGIVKNSVPIESFLAGFDIFFKNVEASNLYAITIGEENVFWNGQQERMTNAYAYIKARYDVPVYQWWSGGKKGCVPGLNWPNIPADGWGIDEYHIEQPDTEMCFRGYTLLQKPSFQIIWAAPDMPSALWSEKTFWEQYSVCRKYDIPMAFFNWPGRNKTPYSGLWAWQSNASPKMRDVFENFCVRLAAAKDCDLPVPLCSPDWDQVPWPQKCLSFPINTPRQKIATYQETFEKERYLLFMADARITGFTNLGWDSSPLRLQPRASGSATACLDYLFAVPSNAAAVTIRAEGSLDGGTIACTLADIDGKPLVTSEMKDTMARCTYDLSKFPLTNFRVDVRLSGNARQAGLVPAELSNILVELRLIPPVNKSLENLLANPSFEELSRDELPSDWYKSLYGGTCDLELTQEKNYDGENAIKITDYGIPNSLGYRSTSFDVEEGELYYTDGFFFIVEGIAVLYLEFFNSTGNRIYATNQRCTKRNEWTAAVVSNRAPAGAVKGSINIVTDAGNRGMFYADDFAVYCLDRRFQ